MASKIHVLNATSRRLQHRHWMWAYIFLLPAMLLWTYWFLIPTIKAFGYSFFDFSYIKNTGLRFVGLENYLRIFSNKIFIRSLQNSLVTVLAAVPTQTILALSLALLVDQKFHGKGAFRTIFYMPYVLSSIAVATVFIFLFAQNGPLTSFFSLFGLSSKAWATNVHYALPLVIIMFVWQSAGFYMLMFLSGLQSIPGEVLEAAQTDGASPWQSFLYIKMPLIQPTTFLVITYGIINAFLIFDQISAVAGSGTLGSPGGALFTLVTFYYLNAYRYGDVGYGSAAAVILFVLIFLVTLIQSKVNDQKYEI